MRTRKQPWNRPLGLLVYNAESGISAHILARLMNLKAIKLDSSIKKLSKHYPIKIRYGNSHNKQPNDTKYNSINSILLCSNSAAFSSFCTKHDIVSPTYKIFNPDNYIPDFPFLLRNLYHRAGKDIVLIDNQDALLKASKNGNLRRYWVPFIPTDYEVRLHYILGNIERIFLKQPTEDSKLEFPIRSTEFGWHYSLKSSSDETRYSQAKTLAKSVAEEIGLSFGAFDMAWSTKLKKYIIWEINTAPGLNENTAQIYADRLTKIL